jgi:hypothetical protein
MGSGVNLRPVLVLPAVAAVGCAELVRRYLWLCWPIAVTFSSVVLGRRPGDNDDDAPIG